MPLRQGHAANITCLSAPSKPASKLILFKNEQMIDPTFSSIVSYEMDVMTKKNQTKLVYIISDPDSTWDNVLIRCEQTYQYDSNFQKDVIRRVHTYCKFNRMSNYSHLNNEQIVSSK